MWTRRTLLVGMVCGAMACFAPNGRADATADARKAIAAAYAKQDAAFNKKDEKGILAVYSPDFEETDENGTKTKLEGMRQSIAHLRQAKSVKITTTIQKFSLKGAEATTTIKRHGILSAENPQTKKLMTGTIDMVAVDIWVKSGKGWQLKRAKTLSMKQAVKG